MNLELRIRTRDHVMTFWEKTQDEEIKALFPFSTQSLEQALSLYEETLKADALSYGKVIYYENTYVGDIWCYAIDEKDEKMCMLSIVIFDKSLWGQGVGTEAAKAFIQDVFHKFSIEKIGAFTYSNNCGSISLLEKVGFEKVDTFVENGIESKYFEIKSRRENAMDSLKLILPSKEHEEEILDYKAEFEMYGDSMDGTAGLQNAENYDAWFSALIDNSKEETVRQGLVPASTYLAIRLSDQKIIGMIDVRHRLNDHLLQYGGHIGYSVRKSERRKGYATKMLRLALEKCKEKNITKVLVTCDRENTGSAKTILHNGGVLENEVLEGDRITQRYWISLL